MRCQSISTRETHTLEKVGLTWVIFMIICVRVDALLSALIVEKKMSGAYENALEGGVGRALFRRINYSRPTVSNWQLQRFEAFQAPPHKKEITP